MAEEYPKTYKIEKGIPMPERRYGKPASFKQLRDHMEIGDSIIVDTQNKAMAINAYFQLHGRKSSFRTIGKNQIRVWRTK